MTLWDKALDIALDNLVSSIGQVAVDSWRTEEAVETVLLQLQVALPKARLLIERSECWGLPKYKSLDDLLSPLKDSVYEAESMVAELKYRKYKGKQHFPGTNLFRNWLSDFPTTVKRVLDRLHNDYKEMKENCDSHGIPANHNQFRKNARQKTGRISEISIVFECHKELNELIRLMRIPSSGSPQRKRAKNVSVSNSNIGDTQQNVSVISIVGMGGIGKTTLAQIVCNDRSVKSYFDLILWACVSNNFDLVKLTKEIIESATRKECNLTNLDALQGTLQNTLNSKRFLLVLDDVWSKDWQRLLTLIKGASEGSVTLVTTRSLDCVEIPGTSIGSKGVINFEGLEKDIYWEFFKSCVFDYVAESNNINPELEVIGKELCNKLKRSPLAAKTVGKSLKEHLDVGHWTDTKDKKMWQLQKDEDDILPELQLSYQYLPSHLKKCFLFCSLYHKGFKFTQSELTMFWIMQGLINPLDNIQKLRTLAEVYFRDLVRRCIFQKLAHGASDENNEYAIHDENNEYVIHDLMHDVCQSITKYECFCLEDGHSEQKDYLDIRHVSVFTNTLEENELCKYKKLVSLKVAFASSCSITAIKNWCNELTNIRSLSLARCKINELPENIGNLKHLQFLDISDTNVETLPDSFCCLYNLQYLNMNNCSNIEWFPEGLNNLVNLLFLDLPSEKLFLVAHIENICRAIQIDDACIDVRCLKIENLKNICKLSGSVKIEGLEIVRSKEAAEEAQLNTKPLINRLNLGWHHTGDNGHQNDQEVLDALCPHQNLKELKMIGYNGRNLSPSWLKEEFLPKLTEVHFDCCKASTISHLPRVITKLSITNCFQLTNLQNCFEPNHLPVLKHIDICYCEELESLPVESFGGFVSLERLEIIDCPNLRSPNAMVLPPSVKYLKLESCGELVESIPSCLQNLTSLKTLWISDCQSLVSIPADEVTSNLKSLSELHFVNCSKLQSLGGLQFLASLKKVTIRACPQLHETRGRDIFGKPPSELLEDKPLSSQHRKRRTTRARK